MGCSAQAESLRIAQFTVEISRDGPGLLLRDIRKGEDADIPATQDVIAHVNPDILVLAGFDYDYDLVALKAFEEGLAARGAGYPYLFALRPNSGLASGLDLDGDGRRGDPRDAQGYGRFIGQSGLAVLSRYPIETEAVRDFSEMLWRDFPGAELPMVDGAVFPSEEAMAVQRLSTTGHWDVPVFVDGVPLHLWIYYATPPVFDGPEDRNGLRNADETRFWLRYLEGALGAAPQEGFVIVGAANLDPVDGDGRGEAMREMLAHPLVRDVEPVSAGGLLAADPAHRGNPALDTADWDDEGPGNLRVDYVLPSVDLRVLDAGVFWPAPSEEDATLLGADGMSAGRHRMVWLDLDLEAER